MEESYTGFTDIPEEMNPNDIHDTMNFPRDSFVDHNSNKYFNNINNSNQPFQKQQKHFPMENMIIILLLMKMKMNQDIVLISLMV